jgi:hypothetical protein
MIARPHQKEEAAIMRKCSCVAMIALVVAIAGVVIALAAYFKNRSSYLYDDDDDFLFDDPDDLEYYTAPVEEEGPAAPGEDDEGHAF